MATNARGNKTKSRKTDPPFLFLYFIFCALGQDGPGWDPEGYEDDTLLYIKNFQQ